MLFILTFQSGIFFVRQQDFPNSIKRFEGIIRQWERLQILMGGFFYWGNRTRSNFDHLTLLESGLSMNILRAVNKSPVQ